MRSYRLAHAARAAARRSTSRSISRCRRTASRNRRDDRVVATARSSTARVVLPFIGYDERAELATDRDRKKFGLAPEGAHARSRRSGGARRNGLAADADWITFEATVSTAPDQMAIAPGLPAARVDGGRPPLLPLQDGQPDPELLRVPVGALRGEAATAGTTSRSRSTTTRATSTTSTA